MSEAAETATLGKREKRQIERHNAILDVAERCFLENGYAGTSMSAISAALGGSKGTLWSYFSSKEELFAAVIDRKAEVFRDTLISALEQEMDLRAALERFCERFIRKISSAEGIAVYRIIAGESGRSPEVGRIFYERGPGCNERIIADFLEAHIQRGNLRRLSEPDEMAGFLKSMCTGSKHMRMVLGIDPPGAPDAEIVAKRIVDVFFAAYGVDQAPNSAAAL